MMAFAWTLLTCLFLTILLIYCVFPLLLNAFSRVESRCWRWKCCGMSGFAWWPSSGRTARRTRAFSGCPGCCRPWTASIKSASIVWHWSCPIIFQRWNLWERREFFLFSNKKKSWRQAIMAHFDSELYNLSHDWLFDWLIDWLITS